MASHEISCALYITAIFGVRWPRPLPSSKYRLLSERRERETKKKNEPDVSPGRLQAEIGGAAADEYRPDLVTQLFNI